MFQAIVAFSLRHRVFVLIAAAILVVWGMIVARDMPIDLFPEIRQPSVIVNVEAPGLAAEEVEHLITVPIEAAVSGMPGVVAVRSRSANAINYIQMLFAWGTDPYRARQLVTERLALVRDKLPRGVVPTMAPLSAATGLVMQLGVTGGANPMGLREYVDWVLRPRLLAIDGISQTFPIGGEVRTYRITPDPAKMRELAISIDQVEATLQAFGGNTSGGFSDVFGTEYTVRTIGRTTNLEDLRALVVSHRDGIAIRLSQIAEIGFTAQEKRGDSTYNGTPSVNVEIVKQPQANTVRVVDRINEVLAEMQTSAPAGIKIGVPSYSQADMIVEAIGNVGHLLRDAVVIVAIVLIVFLGNLRPTVISLLAIPISLMVTVLIFHAMGATLNTMTLGGIAIALGELVDDSVVDVENILRRLGENRKAERPVPFMRVIALASQEVRSGIVYATAIIMLVFVPLFALPGMQGRMFRPLALAYLVSILASLVVSITVTPALASFLFPRMKSLGRDHGGRMARWLKRKNNGALAWVMPRGRIVLATAGLAVLVAIASVPWLPRSFLPVFNEGNIYVTLLMRPDISLAESFRVGRMGDQILAQVPEMRRMSRRSGRYEGDSDIDPVNDNEWVLKIQLDKGRRLAEVMADIRKRMAIFSGDLEVTQFLTERMQSEDQGVRGDVILKIFGPDLPTLLTLAMRIKDSVSRVVGLADVQVEQQTYSPQARISIDYERAALFGITPARIAAALESFSAGRTVSQVIENGRRFDVVLRLDDASRTPEALKQLRIDTPTGSVPVSSFATVSIATGPSNIVRENSLRRIALMANLNGKRDTGAVIEDLRQVVAKMQLPAGYRASLEGDFREGETGRMTLMLLTPVSVLLIFVLLWQRFRSTVLCLIIMANTPLALIGSVAALWLTGIDLNLGSMIGFIAVVGVAIRNSLLKVSHFINLHLHEGVPTGRGLVLRGSAERLMPVLMTALAAGAALVPLLFASDIAGTEILHPVAVAIFGGLVGSTVMDTFTTPLMFRLFGQRQLKTIIAADASLAHETF